VGAGLCSLRGVRETAWFDWLDVAPLWTVWGGYFGFFRRWLLKRQGPCRTGVVRPTPISDSSRFSPEEPMGESMKARVASQRSD